MKYYIAAIRKYAMFTGRARRKEYWYFTLFNLLFLFITLVIDRLIATKMGFTSFRGTYGLVFGPLSILYSLFILVPTAAVFVRRMHDINKSGWYILLLLVPIIGFIRAIIRLAEDGEPEENKYGPAPKKIKYDIVIYL